LPVKRVALAGVVIASCFTYFDGYAFPAAPFWDENYHIASAQKYLHGIFFMELHPPLGKLLIALGEWLVRPNSITSWFVSADYATRFPEGFSFAGYRLVPALCGWATAPVLFAIAWRISRDAIVAACIAGLYVFDNALIVHLRGAMLEGPLLLFAASSIWLFFALLDAPARSRATIWKWAALGATIALAVATKLLGLILFALPIGLAALGRGEWRRARHVTAFGAAALAVYCAVWQIHFNLTRQINPLLANDGYYQASDTYRGVLQTAGTATPATFLPMLRDSLAYAWYLDRGKPPLDLCKPGENGSPFYMWPIGARAINYRWETDDDVHYRYLYLQANPVVWALALLGLLSAAALLVAAAIAPSGIALKRRGVLAVFVAMYGAYFVPFFWIHGVMYLYHYFIPLFLTFVLCALVLDELRTPGPAQKRRLAVAAAALVAAGFWFFKPLTYYEPLTDAQLQRRALVPLWDLTCATCPHGARLAQPCGPTRLVPRVNGGSEVAALPSKSWRKRPIR
jgi:dolichyl-phosphate-mannose--protein O-mannosyl transferase